MPKPFLTRREVLKTAGGSFIAWYLSGCAPLVYRDSSGRDPSTEETKADTSPIDRTLGDKAPRQFFGDMPEKAHSILWNKEGYLASRINDIPTTAESVPLVVLGGGMSGLFSAFLLRHHSPVVLEAASRFGGNSKAQSWNG